MMLIPLGGYFNVFLNGLVQPPSSPEGNCPEHCIFWRYSYYLVTTPGIPYIWI